MTTYPATDVLKFAEDLEGLKSTLEWDLGGGGDPCPYGCDETPVAASYLALLGRLTVGYDPVDAITYAIGVYRTQSARTKQRRQAEQARRDAEYGEAKRRHDLAVAVACPYCGAEPGATCRTAGPARKSSPKGVHDHRDRYRAAAHITPIKTSAAEVAAAEPTEGK